MTTEVMPTVEDREHKRQAALLKAVGLDRVPVEQRELALAIAKRYDLDLLLRHIMLIDGRPYVTRDGYLHIAHRSGQLDGIEATRPVLDDTGKFWYAEVTVYRKDMTRPFTYGGRYPATGGNQKFAPEMALKVAEVTTLRRAFNVAAPAYEERWDVADNAPPMEAVASLADRVAATRAAIEAVPDEPVASSPPVEVHQAPAGAPVATPGPKRSSGRRPEPATAPQEEEPEEVAARPLALCGAMPPEDDPLGLTEGGPCRLAGEHRVHRNTAGSWPA